MKPTLLISACLLGHPVRYDGAARPLSAAQQQALEQHYQLISACPECLGGLPTPRPAAEICSGQGQEVLSGQASVQSADGRDYTAAFIRGAQQTLAIAQQHGCKQALLKAHSPSCGNQMIYNGQFNGQLIAGQGVCASLLSQHGIKVINEEQLADHLGH